MTMIPVQGVSFPRSGHAIVYHAVRRYFGPELVYCDTNNSRRCGCESVPCINPGRTFAKNHDFGLKRGEGTPIIATERYLIQYRNPVRSIVSNFHVHLKNNPEKSSQVDWENFAYRQILYWNRFVDKWVLDYPARANTPLYCAYETLVASPAEILTTILEYFSDGPLNLELAKRVIEERNVKPRSNLEKFEFFDANLFNELEEATVGRMATLSLPSWNESC